MIISKKFNSDLTWNFLSLAILASAGIIINIFVARYYGSVYLGVFNQVFAFYISLSHFAICGIHFSTLKYLSHEQNKLDRVGVIIFSALVLCLPFSLISSLLTYLMRDIISELFESPDVGFGLMLVAPGLIFFSINKILLSVFNGLNFMRAYAFFQACRYILIMCGILSLYVFSFPGKYLSLSLTIAEMLLTIGMITYLFFFVISIKNISISEYWISKHVSFGLRGFMSGALTDLNARVDVITIGYFLNDSMVGIYSFASTIAIGFGQLSIVVRRNIDPYLGNFFSNKDYAAIELLSKKIKRQLPIFTFLISLCFILAYPIILNIFVDNVEFQSSTQVLIILIVGIILNSFYRPFLGILLQGGKPGKHTFMVLLLIIFNIFGNILLIPYYGIYGAAIATALTFIFEGLLIKFFSFRYFSIRL